MDSKLPVWRDGAGLDLALVAEPEANFAQRGAMRHRARLRERLLRERLLRTGPESLADQEVLEMILFTALPRRHTMPIAQALVTRFGSYSHTIAAPLADLLTIEGLGEAGAVAVKLAHAAAIRWMQAAPRYRPLLHNWDRLIEYLSVMLADDQRPHQRVLYLDARNRLIADEVARRDHSGRIDIDPTTLALRALKNNATAMILVDHHRSNNPTPSTADIDLTRAIKRVAASYAIVLHDHVMVGNGTWVSLKRLGLL